VIPAIVAAGSGYRVVGGFLRGGNRRCSNALESRIWGHRPVALPPDHYRAGAEHRLRVRLFRRLALGSHLFPGSSLHANLANQSLTTAGIGSKKVSIPVKEIPHRSCART
jgi:hypothetical protein